MKKTIMVLMVGLLATNSWGACSYSFNATDSQISSLNGSLFTNKQEQSLSSSISPNVSVHFMDSSQQYISNLLAGNSVGDKLVSNTGIVAFEFKVSSFPLTKPLNNGEIDAQISFSGQDVTNNSALTGMMWLHSGYNGVASYPESARVSGMLAGGTYTLVNGYPQISNAPVSLSPTPISLPVGNNFRIGIYLNQTTKELGLIVNGVNKGTILNYDKALKNIGFVLSSTQSKIDPLDPVVNQKIGVELITDASKMSLVYPVGTTDICGTAI
ncbi:hypothetical protein F889_02787 [Acinetobacter colistiniresistens]|uniref:DUF4882 domain-containing protein n=1 Tax=Acinetobacter colistiniresistens TaxID=280145 RepID=N9PL04_9GAMM|nr:DUF4882 family protein [Acinetobacter colistiniresistens]ENX34123.1 hypothetical protein F889_02787 [Acinetobacter colistiniresistens]